MRGESDAVGVERVAVFVAATVRRRDVERVVESGGEESTRASHPRDRRRGFFLASRARWRRRRDARRLAGRGPSKGLPGAVPERAQSGGVDALGRRFRNLRVSLTAACNYACSYCVPDGKRLQSAQHELDGEELAYAVELVVDATDGLEVRNHNEIYRPNKLPFAINGGADTTLVKGAYFASVPSTRVSERWNDFRDRDVKIVSCNTHCVTTALGLLSRTFDAPEELRERVRDIDIVFNRRHDDPHKGKTRPEFVTVTEPMKTSFSGRKLTPRTVTTPSGWITWVPVLPLAEVRTGSS